MPGGGTYRSNTDLYDVLRRMSLGEDFPQNDIGNTLVNVAGRMAQSKGIGGQDMVEGIPSGLLSLYRLYLIETSPQKSAALEKQMLDQYGYIPYRGGGAEMTSRFGPPGDFRASGYEGYGPGSKY